MTKKEISPGIDQKKTFAVRESSSSRESSASRFFHSFRRKRLHTSGGRADERRNHLEWQQEMEKFGAQDGQQDRTGWNGEIDCKESVVKLVKGFHC